MRTRGRIILHNGPVILPGRVLADGVVLIEGGMIINVGSGVAEESKADQVIDLEGRFLAPGLIDLHIHGSSGIDLMAASADDLARLSRFLVSRGVTRYLPTTVPVDELGFLEVIDVVAQYIADQPLSGAQVMGLHFEGPFVNPDRCGALHVEHVRTYHSPTIAGIFLDESLSARLPIRMMTLAPEIEGGLALVEALAQSGSIVSLGHSQASFEICEQARAAGARHVTHFPNALAPLHHRRPGIFAWALLRPDVTLDLIADGVHVDWRMIELVQRLKSPDQVALISDAIAPTGLGDGEYAVWGETIRVRDGQTQNASGTIAGSVISLWEAIHNIHQHTAPLAEAIKMASLVPARVLGIDGRTGSIEKGKRADLVCFDADGKIHFTMVNGQIGFRAE
jgi:N-acetylglucosamine-6-phosphate deacetylase